MPVSTIPQPALSTGVAGTGPAFSAATAYNKSLSNNTTTIITGYGTPTFDTASAFNATTGRFQPTVAGYYALFGMMDFGNNGIAAASSIACNISKNGIVLYFGGYGSSSGTFACATANGIVYLNGSTDYVELGCFQNTGGTATGARGVFNGALIRAN